MGRGFELTFFQRRHRDGQQVYEKFSTSLIAMQVKTTMSYHLTRLSLWATVHGITESNTTEQVSTHAPVPGVVSLLETQP